MSIALESLFFHLPPFLIVGGVGLIAWDAWDRRRQNDELVRDAIDALKALLDYCDNNVAYFGDREEPSREVYERACHVISRAEERFEK